jgi:hypothetical protein
MLRVFSKEQRIFFEGNYKKNFCPSVSFFSSRFFHQLKCRICYVPRPPSRFTGQGAQHSAPTTFFQAKKLLLLKGTQNSPSELSPLREAETKKSEKTRNITAALLARLLSEH